jgi:hypothetical protein
LAEGIFENLFDFELLLDRMDTVPGNPYDRLTKALGANYDLDDRGRDFEHALPTDDLMKQFEQWAQDGYRHNAALQQAAYLAGIAMGRRLGRLEGGAR